MKATVKSQVEECEREGAPSAYLEKSNRNPTLHSKTDIPNDKCDPAALNRRPNPNLKWSPPWTLTPIAESNLFNYPI